MENGTEPLLSILNLIKKKRKDLSGSKYVSYNRQKKTTTKNKIKQGNKIWKSNKKMKLGLNHVGYRGLGLEYGLYLICY